MADGARTPLPETRVGPHLHAATCNATHPAICRPPLTVTCLAGPVRVPHAQSHDKVVAGQPPSCP
jgi:hypothetical protein